MVVRGKKPGYFGANLEVCSYDISPLRRQIKEGNEAKTVNIDIQSVKKTELNAFLRQFCGSIRTTKGKQYTISSYHGLRAGLNRHINEPPVSCL